MADQSDVADALRDFIAAAIYPEGVGTGPQPPWPVKVYAGWPMAADLDADLWPGGAPSPGSVPAALHVSIYPLPQERDTTRLNAESIDTPAPADTYALASVGQAITVTGAAPNPYRIQNLAAFVSGRPYTYQAQAGEDANAVAAGLLAAIAQDWPDASLSGATIILPALARAGALRVGGIGQTAQVVGSQAKTFQITAWADSDPNRRTLARLFDAPLRAVPRLLLADGSIANLAYRSATDIDRAERMGVYRRDFMYSVDFATVLIEEAPEMIVGVTDITDPFNNLLLKRFE